MTTAQEAAKELRELKKKFGARIVTDGTFCASVVKDCVMPKYPIEAPLLAEAASRGTVATVARVKKGRKAQQALSVIAAGFAHDCGLDAPTAAWVISAWAIALGVISAPLENTPSASPAPLPPPRRVVASPPPAQIRKTAPHAFGRLLFWGVVIGLTVTGVRQGWWAQLYRQFVFGRHEESAPTHSQKQVPVMPAPQPWAPPQTPSRNSGATPKVDLASLTITIAGNEMSLNGQRVSQDQLRNLLQQAARDDKDRPVEILCDEGLETGRLEQVKDLCRGAGLRRLWVKDVEVR